MKLRQVEGQIVGRAPALKALIDSLPDVPKQYRVNAMPEWANQKNFRRHLFNWLNYAKLVNLYVQPKEDGTFHYEVRIKWFLKGWEFVVTPEVSLLMVNVVSAIANEGVATDFTLIFRDRKIYIPFELVGRFMASIDVLLHFQGPRIVSIHDAMHQAAAADRRAVEDDDEKPEEPKPVLH